LGRKRRAGPRPIDYVSLMVIECVLAKQPRVFYVSKRRGVIKLAKILGIARRYCRDVLDEWSRLCESEGRGRICWDEKYVMNSIRSTLVNYYRYGVEPFRTVVDLLSRSYETDIIIMVVRNAVRYPYPTEKKE